MHLVVIKSSGTGIEAATTFAITISLSGQSLFLVFVLFWVSFVLLLVLIHTYIHLYIKTMPCHNLNLLSNLSPI